MSFSIFVVFSKHPAKHGIPTSVASNERVLSSQNPLPAVIQQSPIRVRIHQSVENEWRMI